MAPYSTTCFFTGEPSGCTVHTLSRRYGASLDAAAAFLIVNDFGACHACGWATIGAASIMNSTARVKRFFFMSLKF